MASARDSRQPGRETASRSYGSRSNTSSNTVWDAIHDSHARTTSAAPFAVVDWSSNIEENTVASDECSDTDDEHSLPSIASENSHSLPDLSQAKITAPQSPFLLSEPWLRQTSLGFLKLIINRPDDADKLKKALKQRLPWDKDEETGPHSWRLGLTLFALEFKAPKTIQLRSLIGLAPEIPYWLKLSTDEVLGSRPKRRVITTNKTKLPFEKRRFEFSLSYGALDDLNRFSYSPDHVWTDEDYHKCTIHINDGSKKSSRIDWAFEDRTKDRLSNRLSLMNINECVIIDLFDDGFAIYIEQVGNMSDYRGKIGQSDHSRSTSHQALSRTQSESETTRLRHRFTMPRPAAMRAPRMTNNNHIGRVFHEKYKREGRRLSYFFPTVRFSLRQQQSSGHHRSDEIEKTLSSLIQLFLSHDITVCFGRIQNNKGPTPFLFSRQYLPEFLKHFLMKYGWYMLMTSGYRYHLRLDNALCNEFQRVVATREEKSSEVFYRLCVYLIRAMLIRPFVNVLTALQAFMEESDRKQEASTFDPPSMLESNDPNWKYVLSVTITPTVLRVNPLKLCRTNRVLRDPFFDNSLENFILVDLREENGQKLFSNNFADLKALLMDYLHVGFPLIDQGRHYRYLHHTQSQLRQQQFWFYHADTNNFDRYYQHLGNFSKETNPAKYAARMAQCFSTTTQTIEVPRENTAEIPDIYTADRTLMFSDGCGTMSVALRDEIQRSLGKRTAFSAVQLRYAGAKGVVSVDTRLQGKIKMNLRPSMIKFDCPNHSNFEVCKVSAPRAAYLNRQAILLLSNRKISDSTFIVLQQRNYLALVRHLLRNKDAERCIFDKIPSWLLPPDIGLAKLDYIHEPFFRQLLINASSQAARNLLNRTRIRLPPNLGRYMFGIVDEYNVLKPGEVFLQFTVLEDYEAATANADRVGSVKVVKDCDVVITKNPCHHPGDVRRFQAADYPQLRHLKDVIVFSQQGDRPPTHDISGSDLDGDEYLVLWHPDLVPFETENDEPYHYDSKKKNREVEKMSREIINQTILEIAELDCLGALSKLHLAFADKFGVNDPQTLEIAEYISLELDSAKTGDHPVTNEEMNELSNRLEKKRPDFFNDPNFDSYHSEEILGQLYRASKRTLREWNRLFRYHRHLRHLQIRTYDSDDIDEEEDENGGEMGVNTDETIFTGMDFNHQFYGECEAFARRLERIYRADMLEILSLFGLTHESDIWCQNSVNSMGDELEDSAFTELCQLVKRTRMMLFLFQSSFCQGNCEQATSLDRLCAQCHWTQRSVAVACYKLCYGEASANPQAAPILSLPWIFSNALLQGRVDRRVLAKPVLSTVIQNTLCSLISNRRRLNLQGTDLKLSKSGRNVSPIVVDIKICAFIEVLQDKLRNIDRTSWLRVITEFILGKCERNTARESISSADGCVLILEPYRVDDNDEYAALILSLQWDNDSDDELHGYVDDLLEICFSLYKDTDDSRFSTISEKIVLLLEKLAIDETLEEKV